MKPQTPTNWARIAALLLLALSWGGGTYPWFSSRILGLLTCSAVFWALFALRLLKAVELLSLQESVTAVALTVGYNSVSAFIEAFRKHFGSTPARFFEEGGAMLQAKKKPA